MLKELGLPVNLEQLEKQRMLEAEYLSENLVPQVQAYVQSLVENIHRSFCLVVEYKYGSPVLVRIAQQTKTKEYASTHPQKRSTRRIANKNNAFSSAHILAKWKTMLKSMPQGELYYAMATSQSFKSVSKLLKVIQSKDMIKYTSSLFELLNLPATGKISPTDFKLMLEPEQFIQEETDEGTFNRIVLWSQSRKVDVLGDGTRVGMLEKDGVTPIVETKTTKIREGQWKLKTLCDLMVQREYFANKQ